MKKKFLLGLILTCLSCLFMTGTGFGYTMSIDPATGQAGKWEPGADTASWFTPTGTPQTVPGGGTPGGATWSIMGEHIPSPFTDPFHGSSTIYTTSMYDVTAGFPDVGGTPWIEWAIDDAMDKWAAVSGFTNLGQVTDGGSGNAAGDLWNGAPDSDGGNLGDIRIGAYWFSNPTTLGHTLYNPATADQGTFSNNGGDIHINNNPALWVNDENQPYNNTGPFDLYTVILHEIGHALGLAHPNNDVSLMTMYGDRQSALWNLTADDIAGIQAIYGPAGGGPAIPENFDFAWFRPSGACRSQQEKK